MRKPTPEDIDRFFDKIQITDTCWWWKINKGQRLYGKFGFNGKAVRAHRFSYALFVGPIEPGKMILHREGCGNPSCVNPNHLYMGTNQDNMRDMRLWGNANSKKQIGKMPDKVFSTEQILAVAPAICYRLNHLVLSNQITPLTGGCGRGRRFSQEESLKAIRILRKGAVSSVQELKEMAEEEANERD